MPFAFAAYSHTSRPVSSRTACANGDNHLRYQLYPSSASEEETMAAEGGTPGGLMVTEPQTGPDGEVIGGPRTPQQIAAQRRLQQTQAQVDEVVDIMKQNMDKVLDRDVKLSELDDRADALEYGASQFEQQAKSLKNKFWLQNLKMMIIMGVIGIVIIGLLFVRYRGTPTMSGIAPSPTGNNTVPAATNHLNSSEVSRELDTSPGLLLQD